MLFSDVILFTMHSILLSFDKISKYILVIL